MRTADLALKKLFEVNKLYFFLVFCGLGFFQAWYLNNHVLTGKVYYQTMGEQVSVERIGHFLALRDKLVIIGYGLIPLIFLFKVTLIAMCMNIGSLFFDYEIGFGKIFGITIVSELVFVAANYLKILVLAFFKPVMVVSDVNLFYPLSLMNLAEDPASMEKWLYYPFLTINLFEVAYVLFFALGIRYLTGKTYRETLKYTAISYGAGLAVWIGFVMFLSISFS
jgi:hypothetical protein